MLNNNFFHWNIVVSILFPLLFSLLILSISYFLGTKSTGKNKQTTFEGGIKGLGNTKIRFYVNYYLIAIIFVIFDVEALYLYTWTSCIREIGWVGFIEIIIFIFLLSVLSAQDCVLD